jgi:hypothetical protein
MNTNCGASVDSRGKRRKEINTPISSQYTWYVIKRLNNNAMIPHPIPHQPSHPLFCPFPTLKTYACRRLYGNGANAIHRWGMRGGGLRNVMERVIFREHLSMPACPLPTVCHASMEEQPLLLPRILKRKDGLPSSPNADVVHGRPFDDAGLGDTCSFT